MSSSGLREQRVNISHTVSETWLLGPGLRSALWVQGCCFCCEGCVAQSMRGPGGSWIAPAELAAAMLEKDVEGVTISGGEPFLQAGPLAETVRLMKACRDVGVIVYTGFSLQELQKRANPEVNSFLMEIDLLIDGPYIANQDDGLALRGSSNQNVYTLSPRYEQAVSLYHGGARKVEIRVEQDRILMVGVPSKAAINAWHQLKRKAKGEQK